ncbi:vomeronasal type-1 receptor 4-like [Thomomys bottae]
MHVVLTNVLMLLSKGLPRTITALGLRYFLDVTSCKVILYVERVSRGLSICTSTLLTVVQAITISPRGSWWRRLMPRSAWHILPILFFFWMLNSFISMNLINSVRNSNLNESHLIKNGYYCFVLLGSQKINNIFLTFMAMRDALSPGLMSMASGYMVFLLYKHHQRVLYLGNSKLLYKTPPEMKAAQSVLLLMLCFLFFYLMDCLLSLYLIVTLEPISILVHVQEFITLGYAFLSPFLLIHRDEHQPEWCQAWRQKNGIENVCVSLIL